MRPRTGKRRNRLKIARLGREGQSKSALVLIESPGLLVLRSIADAPERRDNCRYVQFPALCAPGAGNRRSREHSAVAPHCVISTKERNLKMAACEAISPCGRDDRMARLLMVGTLVPPGTPALEGSFPRPGDCGELAMSWQENSRLRAPLPRPPRTLERPACAPTLERRSDQPPASAVGVPVRRGFFLCVEHVKSVQVDQPAAPINLPLKTK
jgi:hypothetical protein